MWHFYINWNEKTLSFLIWFCETEPSCEILWCLMFCWRFKSVGQLIVWNFPKYGQQQAETIVVAHMGVWDANRVKNKPAWCVKSDWVGDFFYIGQHDGWRCCLTARRSDWWGLFHVEFYCSPCGCVGFLPQSRDMYVGLTGDSKLAVGVNVCVPLYASVRQLWDRLAKGVPRLSPNNSYDWLQHPPLRLTR